MTRSHRANIVRWATATIVLLAINIFLPSTLLQAVGADRPVLVLSRHLSSSTIDRLNQALKSYQVLEADLPLLAEEARTQRRMQVVLDGTSHDLLLEVNDLYAPGIRWTMTNDSGVFDMVVPPPTTYKGSVEGEFDSQVRLLIQPDLFLGFIRRGKDYLFIEPLSKYLPSARAGQLVAYHEDDVRPEFSARCGTGEIHNFSRRLGGPPLSDKSNRFATVTFRRLQVASDADFEFFATYNNTSATFTNSYIAGILNQVDGIYQTDLNLGISITFQNVYTSSSQPYTSSNSSTLLNQFVNYWNSNRSGVTRDVAHLFTGKSLNGSVVGISYVGAACDLSYAYGLTSDYQPYTMKVTAHEIAHNLGAQHDDQNPAPILPCPGNGWLMCAYIQPSGPNAFSQKSKDAASSYVASAATSTCLSILSGTPVVNTDGATNVQSTSATLNATVNPTGSSTNVYFLYGTSITNGSPVYGSTTSTQPIGSGSINVAVFAPLTGLSANSTYHYKAVATNSVGTVYGNDATFATGAAPSAPAVTTTSATGVQSTSATLNGTVNPNNASTTCYFQWGLTTAYGNTTAVQNAGSGSSIFNASQAISGLSSNTPYHYRLVATNSQGTTNGNDATFTTPLPTPPTVTTNAASSVQSTSATLNGTINPNGSATTGYFNWGLTTAYGNTTSVQSMGSGSAGVPLSAGISGLSPNTPYHFQAVGNNAGGTVLGGDMSFTTPPVVSAPTVTTTAATGVQSTSATLNGTVNPNNASTTCYFQWGLTTAYGNTTTVQNAGSGSSIFNASQAISGLSSNTPYHYRLVATNSQGTTNGNDATFTTALPITPPTVTTNAASSVQSTSATLNGTINPNGSATTGYFNWGLTTAYGNSTSAQSMGSGSAGVPLSTGISGLSPNTPYHFQAVGNNAGGTVLGGDMSFTTPPVVSAPTVTTTAATGVQSTSATLNGTVNPNNASTTCYFQWGLTTAYGNTTAVQNAGSGSSIFNASQAISGLSSNTPYHYRLVATNTQGTTNGNDATFTTALPIVPPTVTTNAASSIQSTSATLNGTINPNGSATTAYFNWGLTTAYGNSTSAQSMGSGSAGVPLSAGISGLSPNVTYHFQAVGNNAGGTVLGNDMSFTTPPVITPPGVTTQAATNIIAGSATLNGSVNPNWGATTAYFQWGTTTFYGNSTAGQSLPSGSSPLAVSAIISGLQSNMTYHYQIVALNGAGTSYGNDISFTTPACVFSVSFSTQSFLEAGGSGTATVTASASDCSWTAESNVPWMTIDSGSAGTGNGVVRYSVAANPSPFLRDGHLTAAGKSILVEQSGRTSIGFDSVLPAGSVISRYSQGQGPLSVTYGLISASTPSPPVALANFGWTSNGVLVTEVGIPASSTMTSTRLFVDYSNTNNSGVGIVNPNDVPLNLLLTLRSQSGSVVSTGSLNLGPGGHMAKFVNELGLVLPNPFLGTLTLSGDVSFAAVNLRTSVNGRGETLFSALPLVNMDSALTGTSLIFPQVVDGAGSPTQILLMNRSDAFSATGSVAIFDDNGNPLALDFGPGLGALSTLDYSMAPSGMLKFSTTGLGPLRVGYIIVTPTSGALPVGGVIFSMSGTAGLVSQAGVLNTLPGIEERLFIDVAATPLARNTGIAMVNNNATTANLVLNLAGIDGSTRSGSLTIVPNGHVAKFITELFSGLPATFQGILTITSNVPIAPLILRLTTNQRGETITSTLPAAGPGPSMSYPLIIPQIVDGGGYQTQLIILNPATGSGQVHIDFLNDSGVYVISPLI